MRVRWKEFELPTRVSCDEKTATPTYGMFHAEPFERGFATTIGNALRRSLLSSIEGAAITAVHIEGVLHEFSSIPGVKEDVTNVVLNLKQIPVRLHSDEPRILEVDIKGPREVRASDLAGDPMVEILERALDPCVAPTRIVSRHADHEATDFHMHAGSPRPRRRIRPLARDQFAVPPENRVRRDDRRDVGKDPPSEALTDDCETLTFVVIQPQPAAL